MVWFLFGAVMVTALDAATWQTAVFVVLALTVARMVPVAVALSASGSPARRRLHGLVRAPGPGLGRVRVIAFDSLEGPDANAVLAAITLTVLVSVVAHGLTAAPLSRRYGQHRPLAALADGTPELAMVPQLHTPAPLAATAPSRDAVPELDE